jgi:hypothetical protein
MTSIRSDVARVSICAGDSLFGAGLAHAVMAGVDKANHLFPELFSRLDAIRDEWQWGRPEQLVFVAAVDLSSDRQSGLLQKASDAGATIIDAVDYRDYYAGPMLGASAALGGGPGKQYGADGPDEAGADLQPRPRPSLAPRLSFLLGGISARLKHHGSPRASGGAEILVIAHHYELKDSLLELHRRGARVGLAFYRSLMEPRWERFGLFGTNCPIKFSDLGPHVEEITTLGQRRAPRSTDAARSAPSQLF